MEEAEERDWDELKDSYMAKVEELIEARKLRLAQKKTSLEVVGAEAATEDWEKEALETESGLDAQSPKNNKVRRVDEAPDASAKGKLPVVPDRRYSAGVAQPSAEDLEAFAEDLEDEGEDVQAISTTARPQPSPEKQYSANLEQLSEEDLNAYAEAWEDDTDWSDSL
ncbi:hypothetical protein BDP27DRAFT_1319985 [Rhodocollybia butyracea]|uniref:Uncharacterized protein n=1 Tax=Rhodocollybia butyracea TaxID=206335 RepID=A0A9P5UB73_9AGAR|nr:hypothetical protein BDP27DRAFT_1319985 [Rhodocollybia butyracea]